MVAIFKENVPHQETEYIAKTKRKPKYLETINRATGDSGAGGFRKSLEYLKMVIMGVNMSKDG